MNAVLSYVPLMLMMLGAFIPFAVMGWLVKDGRNGAALTVACVIGGTLTVLVYATNGRFGIDPLLAMSWAGIFVFPAMIGALAGALLGWLMRRRDERAP